MDEYIAGNRALWDAWTEHHKDAPSYRRREFLAGENRLKSIEIEALGDVSGKSLLHLQCHFGLDTLSWARLGATVTGADFSEKAISLARRTAEEAGIPATFVCANLYDLPEALTGAFDIVFTSYGVLTWLPDLTGWGKVIAHFLKPGGTFTIVEFHPFFMVHDLDDPALPRKYPYFAQDGPIVEETVGSYAGPSDVRGKEYSWCHTLSDVVNALLGAGLRLEYLREFPNSPVGWPDHLVQGPDGLYRLADDDGRIPLLFSIRATKD